MNSISIWNIPVLDDIGDSEPRESRSPRGVIEILESHFGSQPISILEIGVFEAGLTKRLHESALNISEYDGVDPYLGTANDPYCGAYWKGPQDAQAVYEKARTTFDALGYRLHRCRSVAYYQQLDEARRFDVVYVDGDHRFAPALWDMCAFFGRVAEGGLLMVDDYANVDVPDVTRAFNEFLRRCRVNVARVGYLRDSLRNAGKFVPVSQVTTYVEPVASVRRVQINVSSFQDPGSLPNRSRLISRLLDSSPRSVLRKLRTVGEERLRLGW